MTPPFLNFLVLKGEFTMAHSSRSNCELFCTPAGKKNAEKIKNFLDFLKIVSYFN
jgi:hypothetical protein